MTCGSVPPPDLMLLIVFSSIFISTGFETCAFIPVSILLPGLLLTTNACSPTDEPVKTEELTMQPEVNLDEEMRQKAALPLEKMLKLAAQ